MFIKLTNAVNEYAGEPLLVNIDNIISIYCYHKKHGSLSTRVFVKDGREFVVEESYFEIEKKISELII